MIITTLILLSKMELRMYVVNVATEGDDLNTEKEINGMMKDLKKRQSKSTGGENQRMSNRS